MTLSYGFAIYDREIPCKLQYDLMNQIDNLANTREIDYYHPHLKDIVHDLANTWDIKGLFNAIPMNEISPCKAVFVPPKRMKLNTTMIRMKEMNVEVFTREDHVIYLSSTSGFQLILALILMGGKTFVIVFYYYLLSFSFLEKIFVQAWPQLESVNNHGLNICTHLCLQLNADGDFFR
jgi:hypothetical protein